MKILLVFLSLVLSSYSLKAIEIGNQAPDFTLPSLTEEARKIQFAHYEGLVIYIDFWASWCAPCARSFPELNKIYEEYQPYGFEVIAIGLDENKQDALQFLTQHPVQFIRVHDQKSSVAEQYKILGMPAGYLIGADGNVKKIFLGLLKEGDQQMLVESIRKELGIN
jgi:peroxiredoxin